MGEAVQLRFDKRVAIAVAVVLVVAVIVVLGTRRAPLTAPTQAYDYKPIPHMVPGGVPLRPMDTDIFAAIEKGNLTHAQLLDLFPDRPYHVKLTANGEERRVEFVLIDLERDGKWDERWALRKDQGVDRRLIGDPNIMFTMRAGYWIPH